MPAAVSVSARFLASYGRPRILTATLPLRKVLSGGVVSSVSITAGVTEQLMLPKNAEQGPVS
jgi:hypothetical protein